MESTLRPNHPIIVQKLYDIVVWGSLLVAKFPKDKRYTVGSRIESLLLDILETLVEASYTKRKRELLIQANRDLEKFRFMSRLAKDLRFIDLRRFRFLASQIDEVGCMLGGWIKQQVKA